MERRSKYWASSSTRNWRWEKPFINSGSKLAGEWKRFWRPGNITIPKTVVRLFKCHILSFLEGATPAIYHAAPSILKPLDELQRTLLDELSLSTTDALLNFNLAPLGMRRNIAMMGILFKIAHGIGPQPIRKLFSLRLATLEQHGFLTRPRHTKQIMDPVVFNHPVMIKRSIFGLIRIWNVLP